MVFGILGEMLNIQVAYLLLGFLLEKKLYYEIRSANY